MSKETYERFLYIVYTANYIILNTREWNWVSRSESVRMPLGTAEGFKESEPQEQKPVENHDSFEEPQRSMGRSEKEKKQKGKKTDIDLVGRGLVFLRPVADEAPGQLPDQA